jgi:CHASE2 domain-containing sensor protein
MAEAVQTTGVTKRRSRFYLLTGFVWSLIVAGALVALSQASFLPEGPDEWTYDWRTLFLSPEAESARSDIAIIVINEESMAEYDYVSPVDRGLMASLLTGLDAAQPKVIGIDFIYDRKSEDAKTQTLVDTMKTINSPVVFGAIDRRVRGFSEENFDYQQNFIAETGRDAGHVFFAREQETLKIGDQVVRFMGEDSPEPPHLPGFAQLVADKAGIAPHTPETPFISWQLPPPGDDLFTLFRIPRHEPGSPPDVVLPESWRPALKDKIVLIGGDFVARDKHLTPLSILDGARLPGVMVHAQILAQLIDGREIRTIDWPTEMILLLIVAFAGYLFSRRWQIRKYDWFLYFVGIFVLVIIGIVMFWAYSLIAPSTTLFFAWTLGVTGGHYLPRLTKESQLAG